MLRMKLILRKVILSGAFTLQLAFASGQKNVTTFGFQFKPMVPSRFFGTGPESATTEDLTVDFKPLAGYNIGMVIRFGLNKNWSMETGINLVQRNYQLNFSHPQLLAPGKLNFRFIGYEIPLQGMIYVKLGERLYMNASGGFSLDVFPSNVESSSLVEKDSIDYIFYQKTFKRRWAQSAVVANYGFEWRTKEKGYYYIGASFHRPFFDIGYSKADFSNDGYHTNLVNGISGTYLTLDLRYFFHEDPQKKKKSSPKKKNS
jgi:hypothetical protein